MSDYIKTDLVNKMAHITLSRMPANALVREMYLDIANAFYELGERDDVAIIVLRAEGKIFCGGNDISEFEAFNSRSTAEDAAEVCALAINSIWNCKKPVLAAVQGACMGAAFGMVAASDFIIAGEGVKFGIPEINLGIPAAGCFAHLALPLHVAKYMAFTGTPLTAEELFRWGTVMKVVPREAVWEEADAFSAKIAASCYRAVGLFKQNFNANVDARLRDKFMAEQHCFMDFMLSSHDFKEAVAAYQEKRKPEFNGK